MKKQGFQIEGNPPRNLYYFDESKNHLIEVAFENYMVHLGYNFNEAGQLKKWDPTNEEVSNEGYTHQSEEEYLELAQTLEYYVYNFLQDVLDMQAVPIGGSFCFVSDNFDSNANNLLIMMNGKDFVRAGQWSTRCIVNEGFPVGSQLNYIANALDNGWSVLCMNNNLILDAEGLPIEGSETPLIHAANVWSNYVQKSNAQKIIIMSQNTGGSLIFQLANMFPNDFVTRVVAVKIADSEHTASDVKVLEDNKNNPGLKNHISTITTNYIASLEPTGTVLANVTKDNPIAQISSGNMDKRRTFHSSFHHIISDFAKIAQEPIISLFDIETEVDVSKDMLTDPNETIDTLGQITQNEEVEDFIPDSEHITASPVTKNEADPLKQPIESTVTLPVQAEEAANPVARMILSYFKKHNTEDYSSSQLDSTDTEAPQSSVSKNSSMESTSTMAEDITESNNTPSQKTNFSDTKIAIQGSQETGLLPPILSDDTLAQEKDETKDISKEIWKSIEKPKPEAPYAGIYFNRPALKKKTSDAPLPPKKIAGLRSETNMTQSQPEESVPFGPPAPARESTYEEARRALDGDLRANFMVSFRNNIRQNQQINNSGPAAPSGPSVPTSMSDDNVLTKKTPETPAIPKKRAGLRSDTNITSPSKIPRQEITSAALVPPILTEESVTFKPPAFTKKKSKITRKENTDDTLQQAKTAIKNKPARKTKSS